MNLSCCLKVTAASLEALAIHCPRLQQLNLDYIAEGITDTALEAAVTRCRPALQQLRMCGWDKITELGLSILLQHYPGLQYLHVNLCKPISMSERFRERHPRAAGIVNFSM